MTTDTIELAKQCGLLDHFEIFGEPGDGQFDLDIEKLESFRQACVKEAVPDGWKVVPVTPTDEMRDAGNIYVLNRCTLFLIWEAMLAAAPEVK